MFALKLLAIACLVCVSTAQDYQDFGPVSRQAPARLHPGNGPVETRPTPVPILKQINRHNEDGSYTYGYEGADGSFKIETKLATGEVKGKYGYTDETGKVRIVEYGANKYGFQPSGEGITVAPPTLVDETTSRNGAPLNDYDDEPRPQQKSYAPRPQRPQARPAQQPPRPQQHYDSYDDSEYQPQPQPQPQPIQRQQHFGGASPVPQRPQITNAVPIDVVYAKQSRPARPDPEYTQSQIFAGSSGARAPPQSVFSPARSQSVPYSGSQIDAFSSAARAAPPQQPAYTAPRIQQQPQLQHQQQPQQQQHHHQQAQPQPQQYNAAPRAPQGRSSSSLLDQLAKDYALPQSDSQPLHDISFGYY